MPAGEPLLDAHLRDDVETVAFGPGGQVMLLSFEAQGDGHGGVAEIEVRGERILLDLPYSEPYNLLNTLAAVAAAVAVGVKPAGAVEARFSSLRGEIVELPGVVNDRRVPAAGSPLNHRKIASDYSPHVWETVDRPKNPC